MIRFSACFERLTGLRRRHQGIKTTLYFILFLRWQVPHSFHYFLDRRHLVLSSKPTKPNHSPFGLGRTTPQRGLPLELPEIPSKCHLAISDAHVLPLGP